MKRTTRSRIHLPVAAIALTAVIAIPAAAQQQQLPFKGAFHGKDAVTPQTITTTGTGSATHMEVFSLTQELSLATLIGTAHWVAANGDSLDSTFVASADFSTQPLGYITVTEIHKITGGTGRFAGAQGDFILERIHIVTPSADGTHITFGSFHGTITRPGAAH